MSCLTSVVPFSLGLRFHQAIASRIATVIAIVRLRHCNWYWCRYRSHSRSVGTGLYTLGWSNSLGSHIREIHRKRVLWDSEHSRSRHGTLLNVSGGGLCEPCVLMKWTYQMNSFSCRSSISKQNECVFI